KNTGPLKWNVSARAASGARDSVIAMQEIEPAVPVEVWAASLLRVGEDPPRIAAPRGALPGGYVTVGLSDTLAASLSGVRSYMSFYPYECFEQRLSRIVVSGNTGEWTTLAGALPTYLDSD